MGIDANNALNAYGKAGYAVKVFQAMEAKKLKDEEREKDGIPVWLEAPIHLTEKQAAIWRGAVLTRGVSWFALADLVVLEQYVLAVTDLNTLRQKAISEKWQAPYEMVY